MFHQFTINDPSLTLGNIVIEQMINIMASRCNDEAQSQYLKKMMYEIIADEGTDKTGGGHFYSFKFNNGVDYVAAYHHPTKKHTASIQLEDHVENCNADPKQWAVVWCKNWSPAIKTSWNNEA